MPILTRASEKSKARVWCVDVVRPLRGRDSVGLSLSAGSLRSPAVKHGGAAPQPTLRRGCYAHTTTGMYMPERGRPAGLSLSDLAFSLSGGEISKNIYPAHYMDI